MNFLIKTIFETCHLMLPSFIPVQVLCVNMFQAGRRSSSNVARKPHYSTALGGVDLYAQR